MPPGRRRSSTAFTLVELLVVITIVAVLTALMIPGLTRARARAQQIQCRAQLRTVYTAARMHGSDHGERMLLCQRRWYVKYPTPHHTNETCIDWRPELNMAQQVQLEPYLFPSGPTRPSVLTCRTIYSWGGEIHNVHGNTYAMNGYAGISFGHLHTTTDIIGSWNNIQTPTETMYFMDGNHYLLRIAGRRHLWVVNPAIVPTNFLTPYGDYGFTAFRHNDQANAVYFDGHVAPVDLDYAQDVLNVERHRHRFWGSRFSR